MTDQVTDQVTDSQDQGPDQGKSALGWRSALSDEFKEHDYVKTFEKPTDFVKAALEIKTEREVLEAKMKDAIFKPGKGATDEELTAYRKAMGVPEKPEDYEFPETEGVEHDEKMVGWARSVFHQAGLSKEQAAAISQSWDVFITKLAEADVELDKENRKQLEATLREEWGADFDGNMEFVKRGFNKFVDVDFDAFTAETGIGYHPTLMQFIYKVGKAMGEDFSPKPSPESGEGKGPPGMQYEGMDHFK